MVSQKLTRGFTLLEMIVVLFCVSIFMLLSLSIRIPVTKDETVIFENTYKMIQLKSMANNKTFVLKHNYRSNVLSLSFNHHGNVNQAQTITMNNQSFIVQLGKGRYEKR